MNSVSQTETSTHTSEKSRCGSACGSFMKHRRPTRDSLAEHDEAYHQPFVELVNRYTPPNAQILELGCGNGIAAMLLNRSGHDVVGTDISALFP